MRLSTTLAVTLLLACGGADDTEPLSPGAYILEGTGELSLGPDQTQLVSGRVVLFVDAAGTPTHVRDETFGAEHGTLHELAFDRGATTSTVVLPSAWGRCELRVGRTSGCAELIHEECGRIYPGSDSAPTYNGVLTLCRTDETFVYRVAVTGLVEKSTILPDGRVRVQTTYPTDATLDGLALRVDGELRATWSAGDEDVLELGPLAMGAEVEVELTGTRPDVELSHATPFSTSDVLDDLTLETFREDAVDARGETLEHHEGGLQIVRSRSAPQPPFALAIALDAPLEGAEALELTLLETAETSTSAMLVRANGVMGTPVTRASELALPAGVGPVWLVLYHPGTTAPNGRFGDRIRLESMSWR